MMPEAAPIAVIVTYAKGGATRLDGLLKDVGCRVLVVDGDQDIVLEMEKHAPEASIIFFDASAGDIDRAISDINGIKGRFSIPTVCIAEKEGAEVVGSRAFGDLLNFLKSGRPAGPVGERPGVKAYGDVREKLRELSDMLVLCPLCKRMMDDDGSWKRLEEMVTGLKGGAFTSNMCPSCANKEAVQSAVALTGREKEIIYYVKLGKSTSDIAGLLGITESTVKYHVAKVMQKLNASSRAHAVALAIERGIISH